MSSDSWRTSTALETPSSTMSSPPNSALHLCLFSESPAHRNGVRPAAASTLIHITHTTRADPQSGETKPEQPEDLQRCLPWKCEMEPVDPLDLAQIQELELAVLRAVEAAVQVPEVDRAEVWWWSKENLLEALVSMVTTAPVPRGFSIQWIWILFTKQKGLKSPQQCCKERKIYLDKYPYFCCL